MSSLVNEIAENSKKSKRNIPTEAIVGNGTLIAFLTVENSSVVIRIFDRTFKKYDKSNPDGKVIESLRFVIDGLNLDKFTIKEEFSKGLATFERPGVSVVLFIPPYKNIAYIEISVSDDGKFPETKIETAEERGVDDYYCSFDDFKWILRKIDGKSLKEDITCKTLFLKNSQKCKKARFSLSFASLDEKKSSEGSSIKLSLLSDYYEDKKITALYKRNFFKNYGVKLTVKELERAYNGSIYNYDCVYGGAIDFKNIAVPKKYSKSSLRFKYLKKRRFKDENSWEYFLALTDAGFKNEFIVKKLSKTVKSFLLPNMVFDHPRAFYEYLTVVPYVINKEISGS